MSILNRHSNKVAEVAACVNADGARVAQWGWLNNDCQKFRVVATDDGWSRVENRIAGRVLDAGLLRRRGRRRGADRSPGWTTPASSSGSTRWARC